MYSHVDGIWCAYTTGTAAEVQRASQVEGLGRGRLAGGFANISSHCPATGTRAPTDFGLLAT